MIMKKFFARLKKLNNRKGFTLLECVAAIVIIGIMSSSMMALFNQGITYVGKARELDERSSTAQNLVLTADTKTSTSTDMVFVNVPVKIQFSIDLNGETRQLEELTYNFQAGLSEKVVGSKITVKVVYFDMMQKELENLKYD
jgi:prepilin-type N-terminal cleavage/methylation domain-containing protein